MRWYKPLHKARGGGFEDDSRGGVLGMLAATLLPTLLSGILGKGADDDSRGGFIGPLLGLLGFGGGGDDGGSLVSFLRGAVGRGAVGSGSGDGGSFWPDELNGMGYGGSPISAYTRWGRGGGDDDSRGGDYDDSFADSRGGTTVGFKRPRYGSIF